MVCACAVWIKIYNGIGWCFHLSSGSAVCIMYEEVMVLISPIMTTSCHPHTAQKDSTWRQENLLDVFLLAKIGEFWEKVEGGRGHHLNLLPILTILCNLSAGTFWFRAQLSLLSYSSGYHSLISRPPIPCSRNAIATECDSWQVDCCRHLSPGLHCEPSPRETPA